MRLAFLFIIGKVAVGHHLTFSVLMILKHFMMVDLVASCFLPKIKSRGLKRTLSNYYISLLINTFIMILVTVGLVALFAIKENISGFFTGTYYLNCIVISVVGIVLLLLIFLERIRSNFYGLRILLWIIVILCYRFEDLLPLNPRTKTRILHTHSSFDWTTHTRRDIYLCQSAKMDNVVFNRTSGYHRFVQLLNT
uniref:Uncharacterized protein n=1 Tax=Trichobilharzia regenti TaxID=157069 RepID=A0AA85J3R8_TRIRE|nr:unnamed protein product [Trichobilharzia regenti]